MAQEILDGLGSEKTARVTSRNQLDTFAVCQNRIADISEYNGNAFVIASDFISLTTTASFSGVLYFKNTSTTNQLFIKTIRVCSDGAMGDMQVKLIKNPTTGTLISDETPAYVTSTNLIKNTVFQGLAYKGADAKTIINGDHFTQFTNHTPGHSIQDYEGMIVMGTGTSLGIEVKPSVTTNVCIEIQCWYE